MTLFYDRILEAVKDVEHVEIVSTGQAPNQRGTRVSEMHEIVVQYERNLNEPRRFLGISFGTRKGEPLASLDDVRIALEPSFGEPFHSDSTCLGYNAKYEKSEERVFVREKPVWSKE